MDRNITKLPRSSAGLQNTRLKDIIAILGMDELSDETNRPLIELEELRNTFLSLSLSQKFSLTLLENLFQSKIPLGFWRYFRWRI